MAIRTPVSVAVPELTALNRNGKSLEFLKGTDHAETLWDLSRHMNQSPMHRVIWRAIAFTSNSQVIITHEALKITKPIPSKGF